MRKVTFYIDDLKFFKETYNLSDELINSIFEDAENFKAIYTLYGSQTESKVPDRFEITDYDGNKIDYDSLNGYRRGVVLNDCYAYYMGEKYFDNALKPCGVVNIVEEVVNNEK